MNRQPPRRLRRLAAVGIVAAAAAWSGNASATPADAEPEGGGLIGIAMPTQTDPGWKRGGDGAAAALEELGYETTVEYADNDIPTQARQISNMLTQGVDALIIAPIDGTALSDQLDQAEEMGVPVIAYDRLILGSEFVDYYVTFDNNAIGEAQGIALLRGLGVLDSEDVETGETGPFNIEVFAGSPDDPNAALFYNGYMSIIQPFIDSGVLVVTSGQTDLDAIGTPNWDPAEAQSRMQNLIASSYSDGTELDGVIAPDDNSGTGVISALTAAGYGDDLPIIIGLGAIPNGVKAIIAGEQYATIFKDLRLQAERAAIMVDQVLSGETVEVNSPEGFDNNVISVPTYLYGAEIVTAENYQEVLIDSGYFTPEELE